MQRRPAAAVVSFPTMLSAEQQLSRKRSSLLSSAPHTPTTGHSPLPLFPANKNRYSTDSWDSSNYSGIDETEWEWKPEQIRLLTRVRICTPVTLRLLIMFVLPLGLTRRVCFVSFINQTLDALPAHLLTPFNGPIPPSNLLDKIARGVAKAKGPLDWPHSLRATRTKIIELARDRAKECVDGDTSDTIAEEESNGSDVPLQQTTNTGPKRPLYRQSSMDFMQTAKIDIKDNGNIRR